MAFLSDNPRAAGAQLAFALAAAALAGCILFQSDDQPLAFSHRLHVVDEGLGCTDCHMTAEDDEAPGMPVLPQCMLCHADIDSEKPEERRIAGLFEGNLFKAARVTALSDEIVFSHLQHALSDYECASCHTDIESSDRLDERLAVSMDECSACHVESGTAAECTTCHSQIRADQPPWTHDHLWLQVHGPVSRAHGAKVVDRCDMCHRESSCTLCHQEQPPQNHTNYWRRRGHSLVAGMDRDNCAACHRPNFCNRCHLEVEPVNHTGMWGSTLNRHCMSCHFPLPSEGCYTCHKDAPSHGLAAPKPPDHTPGMNCRQCHGVTAPLPHVDNGGDCNICHR